MDENLKAIQAKLDEIEQLLARAQGEMAAVRRLLGVAPDFEYKGVRYRVNEGRILT
mgnify:CR=1 FL=1